MFKSIKSNLIVNNEFGIGINIYEDFKPIYLPVINLKNTNLHYINNHFYDSFNTHNILNSKHTFEDKMKFIKRLSNVNFLNPEENNKFVGSYLELLMLRYDYVHFNPKDPSFKKYDQIINSKEFVIPFERLIEVFDKLNNISYELNNTEWNRFINVISIYN